jgi:hypothetical protein
VRRDIFALGAVAGDRLAVVPEFADRPQDAARHEVEKHIGLHGRVEVPERRGEDPGLRGSDGVQPDHDVILLGFLAIGLGERDHAVPRLFDLVELVLRIGPFVRETDHHRVIGLERLHQQVAPPLVAHGLHAHNLAPSVALHVPVAVHGGVQNDGRNPRLVRCGDARDERGIGHHAEALVVHDDVVALRPFGIFVDAVLVFAGRAFLQDGPLDVHPGGDALFEGLFLRRVVVETAAGDHERLDRPGRLRGGKEARSRCEQEGEKRLFHAENYLAAGAALGAGGGGNAGNVLASGATLVILGVTSAFTRPVAQFRPPSSTD